MSNLKLIDSVFINLDLVVCIIPFLEKKLYTIEFRSVHAYQSIHLGRTTYKTEAKAEERIKQILKNQNNKE